MTMYIPESFAEISITSLSRKIFKKFIISPQILKDREKKKNIGLCNTNTLKGSSSIEGAQ